MFSALRAFALGLGLIAASVELLVAQQADSLRVGLRDASDSIASTGKVRPGALGLTLKSVGFAADGAGLGGAAGYIVDAIYCKQRHGDEKGFIFDPCFGYAAYGTAIGWFGGAVVGATVEAVHLARKRGCARDNAIARAFTGALPGVLPGVVMVLPRTGRYPPSRSVFIFTAPILAGVGAAAAVMGCYS